METYHGNVKSPADAIILFEACRLGLLPRVQRRLSEKERQQIKSGSVFVWDEREAGMRRWTDGKSWSASRVSGSFLTYREMEGKRGNNSFANSGSSDGNGREGRGGDGGADIPIAGEPDGYRYKPDGLMKQSFSITTSQGQHLHLISYCARSHPTTAALPQPTTDPALRHIRPQKGMYPESTIHDAQNMPAVTRSPMVSSPYNTSPHNVHSQNYLRHSPHVQSTGQPHGYGWPPSPMSTPPNYPSPYQQNYSGQPPPPPGAAPGSGYFNSQPRPAGPTAFDRAPPPMRNGGVPPPPPSHSYPGPQHHPSMAHQYPPPGPPNPTSHPIAHSPHEASNAYGRPPYGLGAHLRTTSDPQYNVDPRLGPKQAQERPPAQPYQSSQDRHTPPSYYPPREGPVATVPESNGASVGKIPSITHIINRSPSPRAGQTPPERRPEVGQRPFESSPSGSSKPGGGGHSASNYSEDQKALKQLDRAFAA